MRSHSVAARLAIGFVLACVPVAVAGSTSATDAHPDLVSPYQRTNWNRVRSARSQADRPASSCTCALTADGLCAWFSTAALSSS